MKQSESLFLPNSLAETHSRHVDSTHVLLGDGEYLDGEFGQGNSDFVRSQIYNKNVKWFFVVVAIIFMALLTRISYLQIVKGEHYRVAANNNRERIVPIPAERGLIFDANGVQLTKNVPSFALALVPQDLPRDPEEREDVIRTLATLIADASEDDIREKIERFGSYSYESILIEEDLDYDTALRIHIAAADMPGIHIHRGSKRLYVETNDAGEETPLPLSLSHILGYLGKLSPEELEALYPIGYLPSDTIGKTGIEKQYESTLRGSYGRRNIEVNSLGKQQQVLAEQSPVDGKHAQLSIDIRMQSALEDILSSHMQTGGFSRGSAIVLDPNNGDVLAMVSLPTFDNNDFSGGIDSDTYQKYIENENRPLFHRAIAGTYPSGSTVKPAVAAAALEEGIIKPNTSIRSTGGIQVGPWFFPDWQAGGHGNTDVRKSIAWSVNTFYYFIGGGFEDFVGLGVEQITNYLKEFGFASLLGIDIPGEKAGFLPSKAWKEEVKGERWYVGDTYNLSIGQGDLLVTPLQLVTYIASVANGGELYAPQLLREIWSVSVEGETQSVPAKKIRDIPVSASNMATVKEGMGDCVSYGSCRRLSLLPFLSGAKTGTAQWSSTKEPHAWFAGFAPYDNPEIAYVIMVEEGIGGSDTGAPIAFDFLNWWWKYKQGTLDE